MDCLKPKTLLTVSHDSFMRIVGKVDVVSFDVFDTILHRLAITPTDVFRHIELSFRLPGFADARVKAEQEARLRYRGTQDGETSLQEIYDLLGELIDIDTAELKQAELDFEARLTYANPHVAATIEDLRARKKRVIAVSDMYLSSDEIAFLLEKNGVVVDRVYSSSDLRQDNIGKYNCSMYEFVCDQEDVRPGAILHVGDNAGSDVDNARASGVLALQSDRPTDLLKLERLDYALIEKTARSPSDSLIAGLIVRNNLRGSSSPTLVEQFGYDFGGPLVVGFVKWIIEECRAQGIEHLTLLARDGYVVADALELLEIPGIKFRIIPASRRMFVFPTVSDLGWKATVNLLGEQPSTISKRKILQILSLDGYVDQIEDADAEQPLDNALAELEPLLQAQAMRELDTIDMLLAFERAIVESGKRFAWVDVGWALTSIDALNRIMGRDVPGFFVGSSRKAKVRDGLLGYLFQYGEPKAIAGTVMNVPELIELIFSDTSPSTAYLMQVENRLEAKTIEKSASEVVRDIAIEDVRRGVLRFVRDAKPYYDLLSATDLRQFNRDIWKKLPEDCPLILRRSLSAIPHDRNSGGADWKTIGKYWDRPWETGAKESMLGLAIKTLQKIPPVYRFARSVKIRLGL